MASDAEVGLAAIRNDSMNVRLSGPGIGGRERFPSLKNDRVRAVIVRDWPCRQILRRPPVLDGRPDAVRGRRQRAFAE
jgi:hypothetical protein